MRPDPVLLAIDMAMAASVRREVGPTAWVVLEALAATSTPGSDGAVAIDCSLRDIAREVGLSKDTVGRAIRRLTETGLVGRTQERDHGSGRFARSAYVVDLDAAGLSLRGPSPGWLQPETAIQATAPGHTQPVIDVGRDGAQLSLLDVGR